MIALTCLLASLSASPHAQPPMERLALIIANNRSLDPGVAPLHYADDDAANFYDFLSALGYDARLLTVPDAETAAQHPEATRAARAPTWNRLVRTVRSLHQRVLAAHAAGREVQLFVTYSGHGAVGARGVPYINLLDRRLYRGDFFRDVVAAVGADFAHVIIDACRARDFVDARGGPDGPDFNSALSLFLQRGQRAHYPQVGVFVAESADGETDEWSRTHSGIFAHEVLSGLSGAADVNGDGNIEYSELQAFVAAANDAIRDPRARLRVVAEPPAIDPRLPLVQLRPSAALERIRTPPSGGRFTIEDDRGVRWVDVNLSRGTQATVNLPRRDHYYVEDVRNAREAVVAPSPNNHVVLLASLGFDPLPTASRGSIDAALRSDLFRTPFNQAFYEGFAVAMHYPSVTTEPVPTEPPRLVPLPKHPRAAAAAPDAGAPASRPSAAQTHDSPAAAVYAIQKPRAATSTEAHAAPQLQTLTQDGQRAAQQLASQPTTQLLRQVAPAPFSGWRTTRYISGFSSLGAFGTALVLGGIAVSVESSAQNVHLTASGAAAAITKRNRLRNEADSLATASDTFLGVGLGAAATWGLSWLFD